MPSDALKARYLDGRSSRPRDASVTADGSRLRIVADGTERFVDAATIRFSPATDLGPARAAFDDGGLCEFDDRPGADALFATLGHRRSHAERIATRTWHAVAITVAFFAVIGAAYLWFVPWMADVAVAHAPRAWEDALGDQVVTTLDRQRFMKPTLLPSARQAAIRARFDALRWPASDGGPPAVRRPLQFRQLGAPNAFALPGGTIIVTDEMVALADRRVEADREAGYDADAALATVLAHEAGHVVHRDVMRQLVRSAMTSIVAAWYFGDVSSVLAVVVGGVGTMKYSRDAEHEADLYAVETMRANGVSTRSAATLFRRLEGWQPPKLGPERSPANASTQDDARTQPPKRPRVAFPEYLSTHPATEGRIGLFEHGAGADPATR